MNKIFEINKRLDLCLAPVIYTSDFKEQDYKTLESLIRKDGFESFRVDLQQDESYLISKNNDKESLFALLQPLERKMSFFRTTCDCISEKQVYIFNFKYFYDNPFVNRLKKQEGGLPFVLWYLSYPLPQNILFHLLKSHTSKQNGAINCAGDNVEKLYTEAKHEFYKLDRFKDKEDFQNFEKECLLKTL